MRSTNQHLGARPWWATALFAGLIILLFTAKTNAAFAGVTPPPDGNGETPCITCTVEEPVLWPPNHKLVDVGLDIDITCNDCKKLIIEVWSDEPQLAQGSGNFAPDAVYAYGKLLLRSERQGPGDGRVYLIIIKCKNANGQVIDTACCTVVVPHDQSAASIDSVADQAEAAEAICETTGRSPDGFCKLLWKEVDCPKK